MFIFSYLSVFLVLYLVKEIYLLYRCFNLDFVQKFSLTLREILCTLNS